ncbi:autotransporter outer membrane beta-barrel domain-containing protein, partial [Campylobacter pinnipediorum]|uniref:autotransporter outer membrane beta-barrel domain-containing protein n=1 Tax=Campylobacter pinnipediorum TaxID=1965231 RepID=UPI0013017694
LILDTKTEEGKQKTINFVKELTTSVKDTTSSLTTSSATDVVKFSSNLSTQTRLAKLANPYNNDLALAYAINNLKDNKFADAGDSLSNVVKSYTDRFNNDNNVWGNIIGSKAKIKGDSSDTNSKVFGATLGYDKAFDNVVAGSYLSFAKSKTDAKNLDIKSNTYQLGLYARTYIQNSEIDTRVSIG